MVAGTTATRTRKPTAPVTVRPLDIHTGLYSTSSSDGHTLYTTDVANVTCTCPAGQRGFVGCKQAPYCRHMLAAKLVARSLAHMSAADRAYTLAHTPAVHIRVDVVMAAIATYNARLAQQPAAIAA